MGESQNIAMLAEMVSNDICSFLGWEVVGRTNFNFPCTKQEIHQKEVAKSHPCDCIFKYKDPYTGADHYFLTDLKSYSKTKLEKANFSGALRDLAKSVECANVSVDDFQRCINSESSWFLHGMLFIFNHDDEFDKDFKGKIEACVQTTFSLPRHSRVVVIGPPEIRFIYNVRNDVMNSVGKDNVMKQLRFFYPTQIGKLPEKRIPMNQHWKSFSIELLLSPYMVVSFNGDQGSPSKSVIYYKGQGSDENEFQLLIDFCFRYGLLEDGKTVEIKSSSFVGKFLQNFSIAVENYARLFHPENDMTAKISKAVCCIQMPEVKMSFSQHKIGMQRRLEFQRA